MARRGGAVRSARGDRSGGSRGAMPAQLRRSYLSGKVAPRIGIVMGAREARR